MDYTRYSTIKRYLPWSKLDHGWCAVAHPTIGAIVIKQRQVIALGQHEELKEKHLVSRTIMWCSDPADVVLPQKP